MVTAPDVGCVVLSAVLLLLLSFGRAVLFHSVCVLPVNIFSSSPLRFLSPAVLLAFSYLLRIT